MKKGLIIVVVVLVLIVIAVAAIPLFIDANQFRPEIESRLSSQLGRKVSICNLDLSIWHGALRADNIAISEDPAFGSDPFVRAKSLDVGAELTPLIFHHAVHVNQLTFLQPQVVLLRNNSGRWNFSSLSGGAAKSNNSKSAPAPGPAPAAGASKQSAPESGGTPEISIANLKITGG